MVRQNASQVVGANRKDAAMGELKDKAKGLGNEAVGNVKQGVGKATGDRSLQGEGIAQERKGEAQNLKGKVKGAAGNKV
jgi:uncharacterized protein YjbJ (UPF0337 family)